jgi:hypothetical protein
MASGAEVFADIIPPVISSKAAKTSIAQNTIHFNVFIEANNPVFLRKSTNITIRATASNL